MTVLNRRHAAPDAPQAAVVPAGTPINPTEDFVLVQHEPIAAASTGGILLPDSSATRYEGRVVACGPGKDGEGVYLQPGDVVLYLPHASIPISRGDERLLLLRQEAVLAVVGKLGKGRVLNRGPQ